MTALALDLIEHSGPTTADDTAPQTITDYGLQATWIPCLSTLPPDSKCTFHLKRGLWTTELQPSSTSSFWHCLCLTLGVRHLLPISWTGLCVVALDALTPVSVHSW